MKQIPLQNGLFALVDDADYEYLKQFTWSAIRKKKYFTARRRQGDKRILMHIEIMGRIPGAEIDHKDRNGLNNQRNNLRFCTHAENMRNGTKTVRPTSSIYRGVYFSKKDRRWRAHIKADSKRTHLGNFKNEIDAAKAYNAAAIKLHGEFASLNNIPEQLKQTG